MKFHHRCICLAPTISLVIVATGAGQVETNESLVTPASPVNTVHHFFGALVSGKVDEAIKLTAPVKSSASAMVRERYNQFVNVAKSAEKPVIVGHLALRDAALVVIWENQRPNRVIDLDPVYLVRKDDQWLVLFNASNLDDLSRPYLEIDATSRTQLEKLGKWFDEQKPTMQSMLRQ
jgi:hypothetical protein